MLDEKVLARINLDALLSNLEIMAAEDSKARSFAGEWNGSITFKVGFSGPVTTLELGNSAIKFYSGPAKKTDILLFFPCETLLNNMFSGKGVGFPIPLKGIPTKLKGLMVFMKLAKRMEQILKGDNPPVELKTKLMLNTISKTMAIIANHDPEMKATGSSLKGVAELAIKNGYAVHVNFGGGFTTAAIGASGNPDLLMEFKDNQFFLDLADDKVDTMAALCLREMKLEGDLHMGDIVNTFLDKIGAYLA